jgi:hypothetical protein
VIDFDLASTSTPPRRQRQKTPANVTHAATRTASPAISINSSTSPARQPSRAVMFLTQTSSRLSRQAQGTQLDSDTNPASSSPTPQPNQDAAVKSQAAHVPDVVAAPAGVHPKPKRTLSKREREALALASGAGVELPPAQEEGPTHRSSRKPGSSSSAVASSQGLVAKPSGGTGTATRKSKRGKE